MDSLEPFRFKTFLRNFASGPGEYITALTRLSLFAKGESIHPNNDSLAYPSSAFRLDYQETDLDQEEFLNFIQKLSFDESLRLLESDLYKLTLLLDKFGDYLLRSDIIIVRRVCIKLKDKQVYKTCPSIDTLLFNLHKRCEIVLDDKLEA